MNGGKPLTLSHLTSIYAQATHRFYSEVQTISFGSDCYLGMCYFNTQKTTIDDIHSPPPSCKRASSSVRMSYMSANSVLIPSDYRRFCRSLKLCVCVPTGYRRQQVAHHAHRVNKRNNFTPYIGSTQTHAHIHVYYRTPSAIHTHILDTAHLCSVVKHHRNPPPL